VQHPKEEVSTTYQILSRSVSLIPTREGGPTIGESAPTHQILSRSVSLVPGGHIASAPSSSILNPVQSSQSPIQATTEATLI
jgi:hypothetical protein